MYLMEYFIRDNFKRFMQHIFAYQPSHFPTYGSASTQFNNDRAPQRKNNTNKQNFCMFL